LRALDLDPDTQRRVEVNPLRVLDDKRPEVQRALAAAPVISGFLSESDRAHHDAVRSLLDEAGVAYEDAPRLVRGLDYYTRTLFEFIHDGLGAQSAVGGGGRYDGLSELLGGPALPGVGWALGADRTLLAMEAEGLALPEPPGVTVYVVPLGEAAERRAFGLVTQLRRTGVATDVALGGRGLKGAMKAADRSGARYALILGERDLAGGVAQSKELATGEQSAVNPDEVVAQLAGRTGAGWGSRGRREYLTGAGLRSERTCVRIGACVGTFSSSRRPTARRCPGCSAWLDWCAACGRRSSTASPFTKSCASPR